MILDQQFRTISCNGAGCEKTITYPMNEAKEAVEQNPWLKTVRLVQVEGKPPFVYCSDSCEVSGVTTGQHNPAEIRPTIVQGSSASIKAAAMAAESAQRATRELKAGPGTEGWK